MVQQTHAGLDKLFSNVVTRRATTGPCLVARPNVWLSRIDFKYSVQEYFVKYKSLCQNI